MTGAETMRTTAKDTRTQGLGINDDKLSKNVWYEEASRDWKISPLA